MISSYHNIQQLCQIFDSRFRSYYQTHAGFFFFTLQFNPNIYSWSSQQFHLKVCHYQSEHQLQHFFSSLCPSAFPNVTYSSFLSNFHYPICLLAVHNTSLNSAKVSSLFIQSNSKQSSALTSRIQIVTFQSQLVTGIVSVPHVIDFSG